MPKKLPKADTAAQSPHVGNDDLFPMMFMTSKEFPSNSVHAVTGGYANHCNY